MLLNEPKKVKLINHSIILIQLHIVHHLDGVVAHTELKHLSQSLNPESELTIQRDLGPFQKISRTQQELKWFQVMLNRSLASKVWTQTFKDAQQWFDKKILQINNKKLKSIFKNIYKI
jgi:hypothetical protein